MPDLERLTDNLMLDVNKDNESKYQYALGYIAGKTAARTEVAVVAIAVSLIVVFGFLLLS